MRLLLFLTTVATVNLVQCDQHSPCPAEYNRWQYLDATAKKYLLCWRVDWSDETITFQTKVTTTGWIGLGFSPTGQMPNSDVVIGWVSSNQVKLTDRFATAKVMPPIDAIQNVLLIDGSEADGTTTLTFKRKLEACEPNDRSIKEGTTQVIYSYNPNDPVSETSIEQHTVRGRASINLLSATGNIRPAPLEDDRKFVEVLSPNVSVPSKHTTYQCTPYKLPQLVNEAHIIEFAPDVQAGHEEIVHHILLYQCNEAVEPFLGQSWDCDTPPPDVPENVQNCRGSTVITAWAVGGGPVTLPSNVGLPLSGATGVQYVLMETHYNNEERKSGYVDSSGFRIVYTPVKRKYDGAILEVGALVGPWMLLPPGQNNIVSENVCPGTCTAAGLPKTGIKVFASMLHAHTAGRAIWVEHIRNGVKLPNIDQNLNYDFNFQDSVFLRNEVTVLPGDEIRTFCEYDTSDRQVNTLGGEGTNDEMCLAFFLVYPRPQGTVCLSRIGFETLRNYYVQGVSRGYLSGLVNDSADTRTQVQQLQDALRHADVSSEASRDVYYDTYWNSKERLYYCASLSGGALFDVTTLTNVATPETPTSAPGPCPADLAPSSGKFLSSSIMGLVLYAVLTLVI